MAKKNAKKQTDAKPHVATKRSVDGQAAAGKPAAAEGPRIPDELAEQIFTTRKRVRTAAATLDDRKGAVKDAKEALEIVQGELNGLIDEAAGDVGPLFENGTAEAAEGAEDDQ